MTRSVQEYSWQLSARSSSLSIETWSRRRAVGSRTQRPLRPRLTTRVKGNMSQQPSRFTGGTTDDLRAWLVNTRSIPTDLLFREDMNARHCLPTTHVRQRAHQLGRKVVTLPELQEAGKVDTSAFGVAAAKSLGELLLEVEKGETLLTLRNGKAFRQLRVLNILICSSGKKKVLVEDHQIRPNGGVRRRNLPLSEKLLPGEDWRKGVQRAIAEELGSALPDGVAELEIDEDSHETTSQEWVSTSYPGLTTASENLLVDVFLRNLPEAAEFSTVEQRPEGVLLSHWKWVDYQWKADFKRTRG